MRTFKNMNDVGEYSKKVLESSRNNLTATLLNDLKGKAIVVKRFGRWDYMGAITSISIGRTSTTDYLRCEFDKKDKNGNPLYININVNVNVEDDVCKIFNTKEEAELFAELNK